MKVGFIGLPGSGKTTCFGIVAGRSREDLHSGAGQAQIAVVKIPDPRLDRLAELFSSVKVVQSELVFVDCMALNKGESASGRESKLTKVATDADAFALVIQCFGDMDHEANPLDPRADLQALVLEMILTDIAVCEARVERIDHELSSSRDKTNWERDLMLRVQAHLETEGLAREMTLTADEERLLRGFSLLTMKPWLAVFNVADSDLEGERADDARAWAIERGLSHITVAAELESELAELPEDERLEFLADYGLPEAARDRFINACNDALDVVMFYTGNHKEARAWTITGGSTVRDAAGKIHTDMYDGFIRADVIPYVKLDELGSEAACRDAGVMRLEGRDYLVQDGDYLGILFSH